MFINRLDTLKSIRSEVIDEIAQLDAELARIEELIALHANSGLPEISKSVNGSKSSRGIMRKACALALDMYDSELRGVRTGEVLAGLEAIGLVVGGQCPSANVSSYLHHAKELVNRNLP